MRYLAAGTAPVSGSGGAGVNPGAGAPNGGDGNPNGLGSPSIPNAGCRRPTTVTNGKTSTSTNAARTSNIETPTDYAMKSCDCFKRF
jgi:hypothetical protein